MSKLAASPRWSLYAALLATAFLPACGSDDDGEKAGGTGGAAGTGGSAGAAGATSSSSWPTDAWTVSTPEAHAMDAAVLEGARAYAFTPEKETQGVVVVRGGEIVAEWYADGSDETSWATSWSAGKSFASTLVGIAIDEGLIESVHVSMADFYPQWKGTENESITLENVLNMASGLEWDETYAPQTQMFDMFISKDELAIALDRGPDASKQPPGSVFEYSSADSMLLSGAVEQRTGKSAWLYAQEKLFDPIGMKTAQWWRDPADNTLGYCCVDAPSREYAKFGLLFLRKGQWDGQQIVSEEWVDKAIAPSSAFEGYGYQWWPVVPGSGLPDDTYSARGLNGQFIYVIPSLDLVVVRNGLYRKAPSDEPITHNPGFIKPIPEGYGADYGTQAPDEWTDLLFLRPIIESVTGPDPTL